MPRIEIRQGADGWALYVNGAPAVVNETFAVCDAVADALRRPLTGRFYSEAAEVADVIRKAVRQ